METMPVLLALWPMALVDLSVHRGMLSFPAFLRRASASPVLVVLLTACCPSSSFTLPFSAPFPPPSSLPPLVSSPLLSSPTHTRLLARCPSVLALRLPNSARLRRMPTCRDSKIQTLVPSSLTSFHQRRPTRSLPVTFLTVQKSKARRRTTTTKTRTKLSVKSEQKR